MPRILASCFLGGKTKWASPVELQAAVDSMAGLVAKSPTNPRPWVLTLVVTLSL